MILVKFDNRSVACCHHITINHEVDGNMLTIVLFFGRATREVHYYFGDKIDYSLDDKKNVQFKDYKPEEKKRAVDKFKSTILLRCYSDKNIDLDNLDGLLNIGLD